MCENEQKAVILKLQDHYYLHKVGELESLKEKVKISDKRCLLTTMLSEQIQTVYHKFRGMWAVLVI